MAAAAGVAMAAAALAGAKVAAAGTSASALATGGVWGNAVEVPGTAALNAGGGAGVSSVSCAAAGTCAAGGTYTDSSKHSQAFVANETSGSWGTAIEVPGTAALNTGGTAGTLSVSCSAPGDCGAGGYVTDKAGHWQAFVDTETGGVWGTAQVVHGSVVLNAGGHAEISTMSCRATGQCSAGGFYRDSAGNQQAFVVSETSTGWGTAQEVPGTAALNVGGHAAISSVSCSAAGSCSAGGYYASASTAGIPYEQAFVVDQTSGSWGTAEEVPHTASLNSGNFAQVTSVSCAAAGACSAGGLYTNSKSRTEAFVVSETSGVWGNATTVPRITVLNKTGFAQVNSVSCASPGNCAAGGFYQGGSYATQAFLVSQTNGVWGNAIEAPRTGILNKGGTGVTGAQLTSVSCGGVGNCGAGGYYTGKSGNQQVFVISETNGVWGNAEEIPGSGALNTGGKAGFASVSCPTTSACSAGGHYTISTNNANEAFVVGES